MAALALGATAATALACLLIMYAGVPPAGPVNDVLNAAFGWVALWLAVLVRRHERPGRRGDLAVAAAAVGALLMTWGSWLVLTGVTGWVLAGLVSTLGLSALGTWLLLALKESGADGVLSGRSAGLGRAAGLLMTLGFLALPGALQGVDDFATAPWHVYVGQAPAWLGASLLPIWSIRVARGARSSEEGPSVE